MGCRLLPFVDKLCMPIIENDICICNIRDAEEGMQRGLGQVAPYPFLMRQYHSFKSQVCNLLKR